MFKTLGSILRTVRALAFPVSRLVLAAVLWSNRYTAALWARSISRDIFDNGFEPVRLSRLVRGLWTVSRHQSVANAPALRSIGLRPEGFVVEARADWFGREIVEELLAPVPPYPTTMTAA